MKRLLLIALLALALPAFGQVAETACNNGLDDDGDGDIDCADTDCNKWTPCTSTIKIVIGVDNTISSDMVQLCNWLQKRGKYSDQGWANLTTCPQALFNAGVKLWADQASREIAVQFGRNQEGIRYEELYGPVATGVDLTEPIRIACGDGIVDSGEECDDGNQSNADGCQGDCKLPICGDFIVDAGEECDDGNNFAGDGCAPDCTFEPAVCGDGTVQEGEFCDDGNTVDGDGCNATCTGV